jgi:tRNA-dihydrouridine synthase
LRNPFVFSQIVKGEQPHKRPAEALVLSIIERYLELLREELSLGQLAGKLKQLVSQLARGLEWRKDVMRAHSLDQQLAVISEARVRLATGASGCGAAVH